MAKPAIVTLALCTWNRAELLSSALGSLTRLVVPPRLAWEVVVVDNNSTDRTKQVVEDFSTSLPIRYVFEPRQGLSRARNRAIAESRGELVIFTDDDVLVDPLWLAEYAAAAESHSDAAFFGGTIDVSFAAKPPRWLINNLEDFAGAFALRRLGHDIRRIDKREDLPFGANMAFRRRVLSAGAFATNLGRTGTDLLSGEETEFMERLVGQGEHGIWVGPARVVHVIAGDRLTRSYIHDYFVWQGRAQVRQGLVAADPDTTRRLEKKLRRRRRSLRFVLRRDADWAQALIGAAKIEGMLTEIATGDVPATTLGSEPSEATLR